MTGDWHADCLALEDPEGLRLLEDPAVVRIEAELLEYLKDSWCSATKARLLFEAVVLTRPDVCVDVGAFTGSSTVPMLAGLRHVERGRGYAIDAWSNEESTRGLPAEDVNRIWWASVDMAVVRAQFHHMLDSWSLHAWCEVLPMASRDAVERLPPIDFLHLDGSFSQEGSQRDSELFVPKVVPGGHVVLSNALVTVSGRPTKMGALWPLFDQCDVLCDIDDSNTLLFEKR